MLILDLDDATIGVERPDVKVRLLTGPSPSSGEVPDLAHGPQVFLVEYTGPGEIKPHFHPIDQFQVVVQGEGVIGKHPVAPVAVHYTDGHTPYGPIQWQSHSFAFFNFRATPDAGAFYMPDSRDELKPHKAGRNIEWQVASEIGGVQESPFPQGDGLFAATYSLAPGETMDGRSPEGCGGQFYLVTDGALSLGERPLSKWSGLYFGPNDTPGSLRGGEEGANVLCLQFPLNRSPEGTEP